MTAGFRHYGPAAIRAAVGFEELIEPVADALVDFSRGLGDAPVSVFAPMGRDGDVHVKSAWLPGRTIFTVKVGTWFAARAASGLSASAGVVAVFDSRTGDLVALLEDEHHLSDIRTAAAGALAARVLARRDSEVLGVLGTGIQAYLQALAAAAELPIRTVRIWGRTTARAQTVAHALRRRRPQLQVMVAATPHEACDDVDVLVTATASTQPLVEAEWLSPGVHVTAVGADDVGKVELTAACLARADHVMVDSRSLAARYGDLAAAGLTPHTELGELIADPARGRTSPDQITIGKLIGLGVQDLAAADVTLDRMRAGSDRVDTPASALDLRWKAEK